VSPGTFYEVIEDGMVWSRLGVLIASRLALTNSAQTMNQELLRLCTLSLTQAYAGSANESFRKQAGFQKMISQGVDYSSLIRFTAGNPRVGLMACLSAL
jgi:hypothetical protein